MCDDKKNEEMRLLYQIYAEDLRHTKKQQWQVIYYGLLVQAAIVSFYNMIWPDSNIKVALSIISGFAGLLSVLFIVKYNCDLEKYREKKVKVRETFEKDVRDIFSNKNSQDCLFAFSFSLISIISVILTIYFINH